MLPPIDLDFLKNTLTDLLCTPSPVGDTREISLHCAQILRGFELEPQTSNKGVLTALWNGKIEGAPRGVTAHLDTLGAMVKSIKPNGRLTLTKLGNYSWNSVENESVTVRTLNGATFRGSILVSNASHHLHSGGDGNQPLARNNHSMEVRLDARLSSAEKVKKAGIEVGDFIIFDPRPEWNDGFIRSRFLDDKALVACLLTACKTLFDAKLIPARRTTFHFPNYEEVGHGGASGFPPDLAEVLALDIAPVGEGQNDSEFSCTVVARDSDGPYDLTMRRRLMKLAREHEIAVKIDTFPEYCSDGDALWKAGGDARVALIGPGVDYTHGIERTHTDALEATTKLIVAYLLDENER